MNNSYYFNEGCGCMKKLKSLVLVSLCVLSLVGCDTKSMNYIIENKPSVTGIVQEVQDTYVIMCSENAEGYPNGSTWSIPLNVENKDSYTDIVVGDEIVMYYDGMAMETDPLQVNTVYAITLKTPANRAENNLGITLTAENITPTNATLKCTQSGGEPTGELQTGSWYILESWTLENGWNEMPYAIEGEIGWTAEAWMIPFEDTCEWEIDWEWLYGVLPAGKYRIGKEIMDFRGSGDYDRQVIYAEFEIQ